MSGKNFVVGDLVWAKMKRFPFWPAQIKSSSEAKSKPKKGHQYVYFYGTGDHAWIQDNLIEFHSETMISKTPEKKSEQLKKAIKEIVEAYEKCPARPEVSVTSPAPTAVEDSKAVSTKKKVAKKRIVADAGSKAKSSKKPKRVVEMLGRIVSVPTTSKHDDSASSASHSDADSDSGRVELPTFKVEDRAEPKKRFSAPTQKRIGFLGLGMMGQGIVKNLLESKHHVTVWNRTSEKCDMFVKAGAIKGENPAAVVKASDIIFCCVSDCAAVKSIIFSNHGVLKGLEGSEPGEKGYVELTTVYPETSVEICEAISRRGGKYLEAPLVGSGRDAFEGQLLVLGSGDISLFKDCEPCFHAITRRSYYINCKVGESSKFNVVLSSFFGVAYGAMAEALALAERCKVAQKDFMDILDHKGYSVESIVSKADSMVQQDFSVQIPINHQQKAIDLALKLSDDHQQPMHISAAANELYKRCILMGLSGSDVGALYQALTPDSIPD